MKMLCISDDIDKAVGLKLAGIKSIIPDKNENVEKILEDIVKNKEIGILIITEKIYDMAKDKFDYIKNNKNLPLIVTI